MLLAPVQLGSSALVAVQLVAPVTVQVSVVVPPPAMVVGLASKLTTGAAEALPAKNDKTPMSNIAVRPSRRRRDLDFPSLHLAAFGLVKPGVPRAKAATRRRSTSDVCRQTVTGRRRILLRDGFQF